MKPESENLRAPEDLPSTLREWEDRYWEDRWRLRNDPSRRFRYEFSGGHAFHLGDSEEEIKKRLGGIPTFDALKLECLVSPNFLSFVLGAIDLFPDQCAEFMEELFGAPEQIEVLREVSLRLDSGALTREELRHGYAAILDGIEEDLRKPVAGCFIRLVPAPIREAFLPQAVECPGVTPNHYTEAERQQDGNLFLSRLEDLRTPAGRPRVALFIGGSIGLTSARFLESLSVSARSAWKAVSSDIDLPKSMTEHENIWKDLQAIRGTTLHHVQSDFMHLPFRENSVDLIDACNCLGFQHFPNRRLDVVENLWKKLRVGGIFRGTAAVMAFFEQVIVRKTGESPADWELLYINFTGRSFVRDRSALPDAATALEYGRNLTDRVRRIREALKRCEERNSGGTVGRSRPSADPVDCLMNDLRLLHPFVMAAGITEDLVFQMEKKWLTSSWDDQFREKNELLDKLSRRLGLL